MIEIAGSQFLAISLISAFSLLVNFSPVTLPLSSTPSRREPPFVLAKAIISLAILDEKRSLNSMPRPSPSFNNN
ncbi:MAG: hypothetical protein L6416_06600 [Candidatus Omnitrophica bacterium]|nr:hypothetical protein [Candidatus Omnitrophota bacterium]